MGPLKILKGKNRKEIPRKPMRRWEEHIRVDFKEISQYDELDCFAFVNVVLNIRVS